MHRLSVKLGFHGKCCNARYFLQVLVLILILVLVLVVAVGFTLFPRRFHPPRFVLGRRRLPPMRRLRMRMPPRARNLSRLSIAHIDARHGTGDACQRRHRQLRECVPPCLNFPLDGDLTTPIKGRSGSSGKSEPVVAGLRTQMGGRRGAVGDRGFGATAKAGSQVEVATEAGRQLLRGPHKVEAPAAWRQIGARDPRRSHGT